jgi:hypothetical protein
MGDYTRSTRECSVNQVQPVLRRALEDYFQKNSFGEIEAETQLCCETISEKKEIGRLAAFLGDKAGPLVYTAILLTATHLVWARGSAQTDVIVNAADLKYIHVKPFTSLFITDTGLEISGPLGNTKRMKLGYIGMGPEPITQKFTDEVKKAIDKVNPPSTSKWPVWLGGGRS